MDGDHQLDREQPAAKGEIDEARTGIVDVDDADLVLPQDVDELEQGKRECKNESHHAAYRMLAHIRSAQLDLEAVELQLRLLAARELAGTRVQEQHMLAVRFQIPRETPDHRRDAPVLLVPRHDEQRAHFSVPARSHHRCCGAALVLEWRHCTQGVTLNDPADRGREEAFSAKNNLKAITPPSRSWRGSGAGPRHTPAARPRDTPGAGAGGRSGGAGATLGWAARTARGRLWSRSPRRPPSPPRSPGRRAP